MQRGRSAINAAGFSSVEALLAASIFGLLVTALVGTYLYGQEATALAGSRARAALFAEEGLEATRNIRDSSFSNLTDGPHGLSTSGNQWSFAGTSDTSDGFTRQLVISTIDAKRKEVSSVVTWQQNPQRTGTVSLITRFTNWLASGIGNWAFPTQVSILNFAGNQDGVKVATSGNYAYVVRSGGSPDFLVIDVANASAPVVVGSLTTGSNLTNVAVSGNFVYVSGKQNNEELRIIDVSSPINPNIVGTYDAPGNADANGVFAHGTTVYLVRATGSSDEFSIINAAVPSAPTLVGSVNLGATAYEVAVSGAYAYIASSQNSQELQVISLAIPSVPVLAGVLNISGNGDARTVKVFGTTVVLGAANRLYTINVTTPSSPVLLGSLDTGGTVNDISLGNNSTLCFIADSNNAAEFQIVDIANLSLPTLLASVNTIGTNNLFGVAYDAAADRAYVVGGPNSQEFFIFAPQ